MQFGEAYFTTINHNEIKGWKRHTQMIMNLIVPVGEVRFHFFDQTINDGVSFTAGERNYVRLTVQPGIWMAFEGLAKSVNLVLNISNIVHDSNEALNASLDSFPLCRIKAF